MICERAQCALLVGAVSLGLGALAADPQETVRSASGATVGTEAKRLSACAEQAWEVTWSRFYLPRTHLFYDYLTSYEPGRGLAHLPTASEVARQVPNECGYGTGMEDGMILEEATPQEFFSNPQNERAQLFLSKILNH